jgi:hypothetical protein
MQTKYVMFSLALALSLIGFLSFYYQQQSSAEMMNPNIRNFTMANGNRMGPMMNPNIRNFTMANGNRMGPMMNPNMMGPMMFSGQNMIGPMMMGPMMFSGQNITGSIKLMPTMFNSLASQIKVNLTDAIASAQKQLGEKSRIVMAHLGMENGYLTYTICAIDPDMNTRMLIIDPGNGKILLTQKMPGLHMMGPNMMGSMMAPNMMGSMMAPNMMGPNMTRGMMNPSMMSPMSH